MEISIDRQELARLVGGGLPVREIADRLSCSPTTVRRAIDRLGLPSPIMVRNSDREAARARGQRTVERVCPTHGKGTFVIENSGRVRCRRCRMEAVVRWRKRVKRQLVEEAGGACVACGYDNYQGALEFHHREPESKAFGLSAHHVTRSIETLRAEAAKCVLLCGNCHAEVEAGLRSLP